MKNCVDGFNSLTFEKRKHFLLRHCSLNERNDHIVSFISFHFVSCKQYLKLVLSPLGQNTKPFGYTAEKSANLIAYTKLQSSAYCIQCAIALHAQLQNFSFTFFNIDHKRKKSNKQANNETYFEKTICCVQKFNHQLMIWQKCSTHPGSFGGQSTRTRSVCVKMQRTWNISTLYFKFKMDYQRNNYTPAESVSFYFFLFAAVSHFNAVHITIHRV